MERRYKAWYESTKLDGTETSGQAMEKAGLNWSVEKRGISFPANDGTTRIIPNRVALIRSDNEAPLAIASEGYQPLLNRTAFNWFDPVLESGKAKLVSAGSFKGGRKIWALAEVGEPIRLPGDDLIRKCVLLLNGHDGGTAIRVQPTPLRFVCSNTVNASLAKGGDFRIHHIAGQEIKLDKVREFLFGIEQQFETVGETFKRLLETPVSQDQEEDLIERLFPVKEKDGDEVSSRIQTARETMAELLVSGRGTEIKGVRGTAWGAYNAAVEYADFYGNPRTKERGLSTVSGSIRRFKQRALEMLV